ncbi:DUF6301 family protein [Actinosynnema sp. NPDC050436]|uniref:DUF6301 family protein n=1 Tax=Actinosynnema sp. NPDC050436 TaxID=3155659 RepID=UPI0033C088C2
MQWKAMTPAEVWEVVEFWAGGPWPVTRDEAQRRAVDRFGWAIEVENGKEYLVNPVSGISPSDVSVVGHGTVSSVNFWIADLIREESARSRAFLGDTAVLAVREGVTRWGRPSLRRAPARTDATWDLPGGCRVTITLASKSTRVHVHTPQGIRAEREEGY